MGRVKYGDVLRWPHTGATVMYLDRGTGEHKDVVAWRAVLLDIGRVYVLLKSIEPGTVVYFTTGKPEQWAKVRE